MLLFPDVEEKYKFDGTRIKLFFCHAISMEKEFREHGNKLSTQSIDELAQYFDIFYNESSNSSNTSRRTHANSNSNNNNNSQRDNANYNNDDP